MRQPQGLKGPADVTVTFNGRTLTGKTLSEIWVAYVLDPEQVKKGFNRIECAHNARSGPVVLHDVQLWITYHKNK